MKNIFVKDESYRYGLNAFKGLGGLYAIFRIVCDKLNLDYKSTTFKDLQNKDIKEKLKDIVFVTATDGNHGKGIAWAANKLGCKLCLKIVYLQGQRRLKVWAIPQLQLLI